MPRGFRRPSSFFILIVLAAVLAGALSACGGRAAEPAAHHGLAPLHSLPVEVQNAPAPVRQAYQFAAANAAVLQALPCYCGCGPMGHTSNYACYVAGTAPDGGLQFDSHALGCSICVDITLDAMRLLEQGQSLDDVRAYVDGTYARYGPSNMP